MYHQINQFKIKLKMYYLKKNLFSILLLQNLQPI